MANDHDPGLAEPLEQSDRRPGLRHGLSIIRDRSAEIYMVRWLVARVFRWELKFNLFLSSDPGCLHDHPWPFVSIMLAGQYREWTEEPPRHGQMARRQRCRLYRAPCILFRPARWRHRIEVQQPCLTLNISAPRRRNWGFWTFEGWLKHDRYKDGTHKC